MTLPFHPSESVDAYQFSAYQVCPDSRQMESDFLCLMASLEAHSDHPMATEIVQVARLNNILPLTVTNLQNFPDRGIGGLITVPSEHRPRAVLLGSREFLVESGLQIPETLEKTFREWEAEPGTVLVLGGWDQWARGILKFKAKPLPVLS